MPPSNNVLLCVSDRGMLSLGRSLLRRPATGIRLYGKAVPAGQKPALSNGSDALLADEHMAGHVAKDIAAVNTRLENLKLTSSYLSGQNILGK